jgi:hypothetical protein
MNTLELSQRSRIAKGRTTKFWRGMAAASFAALLLAGCGDSAAERQKEATEIAKGIEDFLALIAPAGEPVRIRHDKVTVTPAEDGKSFAVAITGVRYGAETAAKVTVGEVDYRLTPDGEDRYQVSDLKMPAEIVVNGPDGKPEESVKFTTTAFAGTWSKSLQNFQKFDWQVKDIAADYATDPKGVLTVATASLTGNGKENGKGLLDNVSKFTVSGVAVTDQADGSIFKLEKAAIDTTVEKFDFAGYRRTVEKLTELSAKYQPQVAVGTSAPPPPPISDEDRKAMAELVRGFPKLMSAYGYDFTAEGLSVTDPQDGTTVHLAKGGMAFGMKGIDTDKAQVNFSISHEGLAADSPMLQDPMAKALLPKSGNLSLLATDIPVPSLLEGVAQALPEMTSPDPQVAQGGELMMMGALMSALSQSSLKLKIDPSALQSEMAKLSADGELKLAMQSPQKAVGVVNFALLGLDDLVALAKSLAEQSPDAQQAMGMLGMLQAFSQRENGADGKPVDKYKLDLTETGAVLINGKPLDGMMP